MTNYCIFNNKNFNNNLLRGDFINFWKTFEMNFLKTFGDLVVVVAVSFRRLVKLGNVKGWGGHLSPLGLMMTI